MKLECESLKRNRSIAQTEAQGRLRERMQSVQQERDRLLERLQQQTQDVDALESEVIALKAESASRKSLESELERFARKNAAQLHSIRSLDEKAVHLEKENEQLRAWKQQHELENGVESADESNVSGKDELANDAGMVITVDQAAAAIDQELEETLQATEQELQSLRRQSETHAETVSRLEQALKERQEEIGALRAAHRSSEPVPEREADTHPAGSNERIRELTEAVESARAAAKKATAALADAEEEAASRMQQQKQLNEKIAARNSELDLAQRDAENLSHQLRQLKQELIERSNESRKLQSMIAEKESALLQSTTDTARLKDRCAAAENTVKELKERTRLLQIEKSQLDRQMGNVDVRQQTLAEANEAAQHLSASRSLEGSADKRQPADRNRHRDAPEPTGSHENPAATSPAELRRRIDALGDSVQASHRAVRALETDLAAAENQGEPLPERDVELRRLRSELSSVLAEWEVSDANFRALDADSRASTEHREGGESLSADLRQLEQIVTRREAHITALRSRLQSAAIVQETAHETLPTDADSKPLRSAAAPVEPAPLFETPAYSDDLKKIKGIGPVLEKLLNRLGITTFKQIAEFTPDDVERVSTAIDAFPGRIERDNWISGAREQHLRSHGETEA